MDSEDEDDAPELEHCRRCGREARCEEIPFMGWTEILCLPCASKAERAGEIPAF